MEKYNPFITYLKAIGITLMVLGHSGSPQLLVQFIYMFHMPLFFFASGYCFKEAYLDRPGNYVWRRVRGIYWPYLKWSILFLLLHNLFFHLDLYSNAYGYKGNVSHLYSLEDIADKAWHIVIQMNGQEDLLGGYWFLNALFFGSLIAWIVLWLTRKLNTSQLKQTASGGVILAIFIVVMNHFTIITPILGITSRPFVVALFILIGFSFAKFHIPTFAPITIICCLALTFVGSFLWPMPMNYPMYSNKPLIPYMATSVLATWSIYSLLQQCCAEEKFSKRIMATLEFIGQNTLTILTWHFLSFKVVSLIIIKIYDLPIEKLSEFPVISEYAASGWWLVYFFFAMIGTCVIACCNKWISNYWLKL